MSEELDTPQRLHPLTLLYRLAVSLPGFFLLLYPVFEGNQNQAWVNILLAVVYGLFALPWAMLYYFRFRYQITPDHVTIQKGILQRQDRSIPIERVQNIEIQQNIFQRLLGITSVRVETAGSDATEGNLEYISVGRAHQLRQVIRSYQRQKDVTTAGIESSAQTPDRHTTPRSAPDAPSTPGGKTLYTLSLPYVVLRGCFRFSFFYIILIFSAFEYLNADPEAWLTQERLEPFWQFVTSSPYIVGAATVVAAVFLGWLTGALITINRYYAFSLGLEKDKLYKQRGLFTRAEGTIPLEKVQAFVLRSNVLMRSFGWYSLEVQAMGLDSEIEGRQVAAPLIRLNAAEKLLSRLRPTVLPETFEKVSPVTIRRSFLRYTVGLLAIVIPTALFWQSTVWWALLLIPAILVFAWLQYRYHGFSYEETTQTFIVRKGVIRQRIWIVPIESLQVLYQTSSPFQRRLNLGSLHMDTAGGPSTNYPQVIDLPRPDTSRWLGLLNERFQQRASV
jgi:putative membrane protein